MVSKHVPPAGYPPGYLQVSWPDSRLNNSQGGRKSEPPATAGQATPVNKVCAATTTMNAGGYSKAEFSSFNLATHVGDDTSAVLKNREKLINDLNLPAQPHWLEQTHSNIVYRANGQFNDVVTADACTTDETGVVCVVLTADCLPVFICNKMATEVAVVHAGWRGLHQGIIGETVRSMHSKPEELLVNLGPAIGPQVFEVGEEVRTAFVDQNTSNNAAFIKTSRINDDNGYSTSGHKKLHYMCDMYQLARNELLTLGINQVSGGDHCTFTDSEQFYSYRRSPQTGRMASLIWLA